MLNRFKFYNALFNGMALLLMAAGMIAGPILENSTLVACLAAVGTVVKGWNDLKKYSFKVDMSRFAFTTYAKALMELRTYVRGIPFEGLEGFLIKTQTLDDTIIDFTPPCYVDGCHRPLKSKSYWVEKDKRWTLTAPPLCTQHHGPKKKTKKKDKKTSWSRECWSLLKGAAQVGVKLGKSKRYKRMGALGVGGAVSNSRRRLWAVWNVFGVNYRFYGLCVKRSQSF